MLCHLKTQVPTSRRNADVCISTSPCSLSPQTLRHKTAAHHHVLGLRNQEGLADGLSWCFPCLCHPVAGGAGVLPSHEWPGGPRWRTCMPGGGVAVRLPGTGGWPRFRLLRAWELGSEGCISEESIVKGPFSEGQGHLFHYILLVKAATGQSRFQERG